MIQRSRRVAPEEKAAFHQVVGAGRSHIKRQFLGLTPADEDQIVRLVEHHLDTVTRG